MGRFLKEDFNWTVDRTQRWTEWRENLRSPLSVIEIYFIHNISAPDIVFSTYNNISPPNCAIIFHFALNTRNTSRLSLSELWAIYVAATVLDK